MTKKSMLFMTNAPVVGREDEWNTWYDDVHIPEILDHLEQVQAITRYRQYPSSANGSDQAAYCTVYEIESDDPAVVVDNLVSSARGGTFKMTDATAPGTKMFLWEECAPRVDRSR